MSRRWKDRDRRQSNKGAAIDQNAFRSLDHEHRRVDAPRCAGSSAAWPTTEMAHGCALRSREDAARGREHIACAGYDGIIHTERRVGRASPSVGTSSLAEKPSKCRQRVASTERGLRRPTFALRELDAPYLNNPRHTVPIDQRGNRLKNPVTKRAVDRQATGAGFAVWTCPSRLSMLHQHCETSDAESGTSLSAAFGGDRFSSRLMPANGCVRFESRIFIFQTE